MFTEKEQKRFKEIIEEDLKKEKERKEKILSSMTEVDFDFFIKILSECEDQFLDIESLCYNPLENFNENDFRYYWDYLNYKLNINFDDPKNDYSDMFPDSRIFLEYKGNKFIMRLLIGQGSALQFIMKEDKDWPEKNPMLFDESKKIVVII